MYIRKKMRTRIIIIAVIAILFIYWRGITKVASEKGWNCNYQVVYALCSAKNNKAVLPTIFDVFKAGVKF